MAGFCMNAATHCLMIPPRREESAFLFGRNAQKRPRNCVIHGWHTLSDQRFRGVKDCYVTRSIFARTTPESSPQEFLRVFAFALWREVAGTWVAVWGRNISMENKTLTMLEWAIMSYFNCAISRLGCAVVSFLLLGTRVAFGICKASDHQTKAFELIFNIAHILIIKSSSGSVA